MIGLSTTVLQASNRTAFAMSADRQDKVCTQIIHYSKVLLCDRTESE